MQATIENSTNKIGRKTSTLTCLKLPLSTGAIIKSLRGTDRGKLRKPLNEAFNNTTTLAVSERRDVSPPS